MIKRVSMTQGQVILPNKHEVLALFMDQWDDLQMIVDYEPSTPAGPRKIHESSLGEAAPVGYRYLGMVKTFDQTMVFIYMELQ